MTSNVEPIRKKTLWQNVSMMERIVEATAMLVEDIEDPIDKEPHQKTLEENREILERLKERAETVEGPRP